MNKTLLITFAAREDIAGKLQSYAIELGAQLEAVGLRIDVPYHKNRTQEKLNVPLLTGPKQKQKRQDSRKRNNLGATAFVTEYFRSRKGQDIKTIDLRGDLEKAGFERNVANSSVSNLVFTNKIRRIDKGIYTWIGPDTPPENKQLAVPQPAKLTRDPHKSASDLFFDFLSKHESGSTFKIGELVNHVVKKGGKPGGIYGPLARAQNIRTIHRVAKGQYKVA